MLKEHQRRYAAASRQVKHQINVMLNVTSRDVIQCIRFTCILCESASSQLFQERAQYSNEAF